MLAPATRFAREDKGQAVVVAALGLSVLLLMAGLGVDVGFLRYKKQQMQKAADAGAIAGAAALIYGGAVTDAARNDTKANGFQDQTNGIIVTVNNPPQTDGDPFKGNNSYVEVIVAQPQPTFFMRVGGFNGANVSARALASTTGSAAGCIYVLAPTLSSSYTASGSAKLQSTCGMFVDSNNSKAYTDSGGACTNTTGTYIVGGINQNVCSSPTPDTGIAPFSDPLAGLPKPTGWSCPAQPPSIPAGCSYSKSGGLNCSSKPQSDLKAGVYCGGITISAAAVSATFDPGTYVLAGGGLTASGGVNIYGTGGVTFYNTTDPSGSAGYKPITVSGGSTTDLVAPTSGTYAGILFYQDRNLPATNLSKQNTVSGGSNALFEGVLYFPTTPLVYSGGSDTTSYTLLVAWTLTISGSSTTYVNSNYSSLPNGASPIHSAVLVE